jgi:cysteine desulfuration protein SufE
MMPNPAPRPAIEAIASDFELLDDWEDRYRYVIELGRQLPALPAAAKTDANKVRGCASQVWLDTRLDGPAGSASTRLSIQGESDSHIVQGLIAILLSLADGRTAGEIAGMDIAGRFAALGLREHLTPQRSNGLASMVARLKADAQAVMEGT